MSERGGRPLYEKMVDVTRKTDVLLLVILKVEP